MLDTDHQHIAVAEHASQLSRTLSLEHLYSQLLVRGSEKDKSVLAEPEQIEERQMEKTSSRGKLLKRKRVNEHCQDDHQFEDPVRLHAASKVKPAEASGGRCPTANRNFLAPAPLFRVVKPFALDFVQDTK